MFQGDSGGPLVVNNELIGVLKGSFGGCGPSNIMSYYMSVIYGRSWIEKTMKTEEGAFN